MADVEQQEAPAPLAEREAAPPAGGARRAWSSVRGLLVGRPETGALFGAAVMFAFFGIRADHFLSRSAVSDMAIVTAVIGILAMSVTLLMIAGHFDLSVGSVVGFGSFLVPYLMLEDHGGFSGPAAFATAFVVCLALGERCRRFLLLDVGHP